MNIVVINYTNLSDNYGLYIIIYDKKNFQIFISGYDYFRFDVIIIRHILSEAHIYVSEYEV